MKNEMVIQPKQKLMEWQRKLFHEILHKELPKLIRKSNRKDYLTTKDLRDDFGISYDLQRYYRDEGLLPYSQEGRKIWYDADDIDQFMYDRKIEAKK